MPTTCTVTGNLKSLSGGAIAQGTVIFELANIGTGNPISIPGTTLFPILRVQIQSASDGSFTTQLWGNDNISPVNTIYKVTFGDSLGKSIGPIQYSITGSSINLNTLAAVSGTIPPVLIATVGPRFQQFTSNGTFTIPASVSAVKVTVVGGGGGGGGANNTIGGSGGGSGGAGIKWLTGLTPGNTLAVTVGASGGGVSAANGNAGGSSSVASGTQIITSIVANGGGGGFGVGNLNGAGGGGAIAGSGGDLNLGGAGGQSTSSATIQAGSGASSIFGGGAGSPGVTGTGNPAPSPGGGGSGALGGANAAGGFGATGIVIFEWVG